MPVTVKPISKVHVSVISTLCYFDIFNYPLTFKEIVCFSDLVIPVSALMELVEFGIVVEDGDFYFLSISNNYILERVKGNERAKSLETKAVKQALLIGSFPFVRSVSLSGSMSKGYMAEDADLDFFIVTAPKRLWLARTLLILYKKVFLLNSRKFFCVNYFVDTDHLQIEEENRFTGTELITLRNVYGFAYHKQLLAANDWVNKLFPKQLSNHLNVERNEPPLKHLLESFLSTKMGDVLDQLCMKLTIRRWKRQFVGMAKQDFELAFKSRKYVSKHHPRNYQKYVLTEIEKRKEIISRKFGVEWE